jgi:CxxC motif-containing protein (DUF1111 family)
MNSKIGAIRFGLISALIVGACGLVAAQSGTRLAKLEAGEERPGGSATTNRATKTRNAFSQHSAGIGFEGESRFKVGNAIFRKIWVSAPASTKSSDGLGPIYNARACQHCHLKDGRGHTPAGNWPDDDAVSMFLRLSIPPQTEEHKRLLAERRTNVIPEPTYGGQLQDLSIQGHAGEGRMHIEYEDVPVELGDGTVVSLRRPTYSVKDLGYGPMHPETMFSPRVAPPMIGLGLLEAIPEAAIRANADPLDENGDGISGRTSEVWSNENQQVALGRFGWKAGNPTVRQQSSDAFAGDMGLSTPMFAKPSGDCTQAQARCLGAPNGEQDANPEVTQQMIDLVIFYSQNLAVPKRRDANSPEVLRGKKIFQTVGCASCHKPTYKTGKVAGQPHLSQQRIWPYTDLLLHDMGDGLADNRPEGVANGREWKTPPLWGIGLTRMVSGHAFLLHDGRARGVEEAILWHGGEAAAARNAYAELSKEERDALIDFVNSL